VKVIKQSGLGFDVEVFLMNVLTANRLDGGDPPWHITYNPVGNPGWPDEWDYGDGPVYFHRDRTCPDRKLLIESDFGYRQRNAD
jgi:hypothetical protein